MRHREYGGSTPFLDILFNCLLFFVAMFYFAFILMNPKEQKQAKTDAKAEYIITISWPQGANDDVDTYLQDPMGNLVFFRRREDGLMHLDRDDQGGRWDFIVLPDGSKVEFKENREIVTIRGIIPGEYALVVHMYRKIGKEPCMVHSQIDKINPQVQTVDIYDVPLKFHGDEQTIVRFRLDKEGGYHFIDRVSKKIVEPLNTSATWPEWFDHNDPGLPGIDGEESYDEESAEPYDPEVPTSPLSPGPGGAE